VLAIKRPADAQTFDRLVLQHERALFRYTARRLQDHSACEDVVNETFLVAWRRWRELPAPDRELAWLYAIAFRVLSNHRRSRDRRERLYYRLSLERSLDPSHSDPDGPNLESLIHCLHQLGSNERELMELIYWEGLSYRDIALIFDISENAVGIRITRVKKKLKTLIEELDGGAIGPPSQERGAES
jgi:RNA polymerase sigma factor (sigma-70 family)